MIANHWYYGQVIITPATVLALAAGQTRVLVEMNIPGEVVTGSVEVDASDIQF